MGKHLDKKIQLRIAVYAMNHSMTETGRQFGITRQLAQQVTNRQLPNLFLSHELYSGDGKKRDISELRAIFNKGLTV